MDRRKPLTPDGIITRGTTGINRLRRSDRWLVHHPDVRELLISISRPQIIDLGYGSAPNTTLELASRLRVLNPNIEVLGLEIDPSRIVPSQDNVHFRLGGFELAGRTAHLVRAFNVLRQYPESAVLGSWDSLRRNLHPQGLIIEGTCDELGRHCSWVLLNKAGPQTFTLAWAPTSIERPSDLAPRLVKSLIHRNVLGEPIYQLLIDADRAWDRAAALAPFGPRIRWRAALQFLSDEGYPVTVPQRRLRDNLLTLPYDAVAPT